MKTKILAVALMGLGVACGKDSTVNDAANAVPSADMLSMQVDSGASAQALSVTPSQLDAATQELTQNLDDAVGAVHSEIDTLRTTATKKTVSQGKNECSQWEATANNVSYRLQSCDHDGFRNIFYFTLEGRPASSTSDADYIVISAGQGISLPSYQNARRGHGLIGYDFDNWTTLNGTGPAGKVAVGYRAAGRARTLDVAFDKFALATETPRSAVLRYHHVIDVGGTIVFATHADLIEANPAGGFQVGQDGVAEYARLAMSWAKGLGARVSALVCGGSVGPLLTDCVREVECFDQTSNVTFEDIRTGAIAGAFSPTQCPAVAQDPGDPPSDADVTTTTSTNTTIPGPAVTEPAATPDE